MAPLFVREPGRYPHVDLDQLIAATVPPQTRDTFSRHPDDVTGLRARSDLEVRRAAQCRDLDLRAQRGLRERERKHHHDVVAAALEHLVLVDLDHDQEIAGGTAAGADVPLSPQRQVVPRFDPGGNLHLDAPLFPDAALAAAHPARVGDDLPFPMTARAWMEAHELPEDRPLGLSDLAAPPARRATRGVALRAPLAAARRARLKELDPDRLLDTGGHLLERHAHAHLDIAATQRSAPASCARRAEEIFEAAEIAHERPQSVAQVELLESSAPAGAAHT